MHRQASNLHSEGRHSSAAAVGTALQRTLVPRGFECVAHPVFFRYGDDDEDTVTRATRERGPRRRTNDESASRLRAAASTTSASVRASVASVTTSSTRRNHPDIAALSTLEDDGLDDEGSIINSKNRVNPGSGGHNSSGQREMDVVCPICLERRQMPVTLTSCLHTFCHSCILGWYEHTVALALKRGDFFHLRAPGTVDQQREVIRYGEQNISSINGSSSNSTRARSTSSGSESPEPYRCPLCKVPGPYFLAVEPIRSGPSKNRIDTKKRPKLNFKLMGAKTVLGGGGPTSGGVVVGREGSGRGVGYPSMVELRAAARTQLALAAAVSALDENITQKDPLQGKIGANCEGRKEAASVRGDKLRSARRDRDGRERRKTRKRHRQSTVVASDEDNSQESSADLEEDRGGDNGGRPKTEKARMKGFFDEGLPWEPGAMTAEDALEAIEVMLAREKDKLRSSSGGCSMGGASSAENP